jgi:hypothetical protein
MKGHGAGVCKVVTGLGVGEGMQSVFPCGLAWVTDESIAFYAASVGGSL